MRRLLPALVIAACLAVTGQAAATIVPQKGMAGIRLGMTQTKVRAVLGEPLAVVHGTNDFGPYTELRYPHRVAVVFQGDVDVTAVSTTGKYERTASGLGVGSTKSAVRAGLRNETCESFPGGSICYLGRLRPGDRSTTFFFAKGRVTRVTIGFVID